MKELKLLISSENRNETFLLKEDVEEIEKFVEENFDSKNIDYLKNPEESKSKNNSQFNEIGEELINNDIKIK